MCILMDSSESVAPLPTVGDAARAVPGLCDSYTVSVGADLMMLNLQAETRRMRQDVRGKDREDSSSVSCTISSDIAFPIFDAPRPADGIREITKELGRCIPGPYIDV